MPDSSAIPEDLTPHLRDLEGPFDSRAARTYDPAELVRFALTLPGNYWSGLALDWLDQGLPASGLGEDLSTFERDRRRPQTQRHQARRVKKAAQS